MNVVIYRQVAKFVKQTLRLMVGITDYDRYVAHMQLHHPDQPIMTHTEFFRNRQNARYGGKSGTSRCC